MYESFFGFRERPFQLTPNPRFLYLNPAHREALATLRYGLTSSLGITLLIGEAGTGKTTLLRAALNAEWRPQHRHAVLCNPTLTPADFYDILADSLGLHYATGQKGRFLLAFERDLRSRHEAGGTTAIVVDEAQSLSHELFEEIRLLANFETETAKLVNVVLVGQPELDERLNDPALRQLKQRVVLRAALAPLDLQSTADYISTRLQVAGVAPGSVFTKDAVRAIHHASRGIPRTIGVVCENALLAGYAAERKPVDRATVVGVCRDFGLPIDAGGSPARPGAARAAGPDQAAAAAPARREAASPPAAPPEEPRSRRAPSRSWFSRRKDQQPQRIFKFF